MIEKIFSTGSITLNYEEGSSSGSPMLLLHALSTNIRSFDSLIPELEKYGHIYALDLRGHGKSAWAESYKLQDYLSDVMSFIKDCIKEPTIVFGHSVGGMLGIMLAASYPELVKALIIGDSIISKEFHQEVTLNTRDAMIYWRELAQSSSLDTIVTGLKRQLFPISGQAELVSAYKIFDGDFFCFRANTIIQIDPEALTADIDRFDETYAEYIPDQLFPEIQCPVLLLQANPNLGGLVRDCDVMKALSLLPNAFHVKINSVGHYLHMLDKDPVAKAVISFIKGLR